MIDEPSGTKRATKHKAAKKKVGGPRAGSGRPPGKPNYEPPDKGAALAILDFFGGDVKRTAQAIGINRETLSNWRKELDPESATEIWDIRNAGEIKIRDLLLRLIQALCVFALMRAGSATFEELYYMMGIICDKIDKFERSSIASKAQAVVAAQAAAAMPAPIATEDTAEPAIPPVDQAKKAQWEKIVRQVIIDSEAEGKPTTRKAAIESIVNMRPDAQEYLC